MLSEVVVEEGDILFDFLGYFLIIFIVLTLQVGGPFLVYQADQFVAYLKVVLHPQFLQSGVVGVVMIDFDEQFVVDEQELFLFIFGLTLSPLLAICLLIDAAEQFFLLFLLLGLVEIPQHAV